jgi:hypothetical protein
MLCPAAPNVTVAFDSDPSEYSDRAQSPTHEFRLDPRSAPKHV